MKKLFVFLIVLPFLTVMNNSCNWDISTLEVKQSFIIVNKTTKNLKLTFKVRSEYKEPIENILLDIDEIQSLVGFKMTDLRIKEYEYPNDTLEYIYLYDQNDVLLYSQKPIDNSKWVKEIDERIYEISKNKYTYVGFTLTITDEDLKVIYGGSYIK